MLRVLRPLFLLAVTAIPWTVDAQTIVARITDQTGQEVSVRLKIDTDGEHAPEHAKFLKSITSRKPVVCALAMLKSTCFRSQTSLFGNEEKSEYGANLVFVQPIPTITVKLSGNVDSWFADQKKIAARPSKLPDATMRLPISSRKYREALTDYDSYFADTYGWSYEPLGTVKDGKIALQALEELSKIRTTGACVGADGEGAQYATCAAVYQFKSEQHYSGYAYCAFTRAGNVTSPPHDCVALFYVHNGEEYLSAYPSPFIGEGFGAGFDGLRCTMKTSNGLANLMDNAKTIAGIVAASKIGVSLTLKNEGGGSIMLYGKREFEISRVLAGQYEYTTATFIVDATQSDISMSGQVAVALNSQNVRQRSEFLEPDDKSLTRYQEEAFEDLKQRLMVAFPGEVICTHQ